ncbi:MAG: hypothetical protein COA42_13055 [Alteromonadaceae bacterium]|nr:MAG: hypothetical protein COA42_13055 [Alteromonadaceae bacterium]
MITLLSIQSRVDVLLQQNLSLIDRLHTEKFNRLTTPIQTVLFQALSTKDRKLGTHDQKTRVSLATIIIIKHRQ